MAPGNPRDSSARPAPIRRTRLVRWLGLLCITYICIVGLFMWFEESLIFPAPRYPSGDWVAEHVDREEVHFRSADGVPLHGWYFDHPSPKAHILYCHGNAEHVAYLGDYLSQLAQELDVAVFVFDYRGYGRSAGQPNESGVLADGQAALEWLASRAGIAPSQAVLVGRSLGGAIAIDLAATNGARGLILENTFSSIPDVAASHYPWLPVRLLMRTRFDSVSKIGRYRGPLLQCHGDCDEIVPFRCGRALFDAAGGEQKRFLSVRGGGHNDPPSPEYRQAVSEFLDSLVDHSAVVDD